MYRCQPNSIGSSPSEENHKLQKRLH